MTRPGVKRLRALRQAFSVAPRLRRRGGFVRKRQCLRLLADDTTYVVVGHAGEAIHLFLGRFAQLANLGDKVRRAFHVLVFIEHRYRSSSSPNCARISPDSSLCPRMYLLVEMPEFAARIAQEELALDPDGQAEKIGEEQSAVKRNALKTGMGNEACATGRRKRSSWLSQKPSARKISVATNAALAIIEVPFRCEVQHCHDKAERP